EAWKKLRGIAPGLVDPDKNEFLSPVKYFAKTDQSDDAEARYGLWLFVNTLSNELGGVSSFLTGLNSGSAFVSDLQKKLTQYVRELNNPPQAGVEIDQGAKAGSVCEVFTNLIPQPAEWSVNKLFLDTLVLIKKSGNGEVFHSISYPLPDYEVIWPVSETLLGMVDDPALISAGLSITPPDQKSQKVKVTLNLSIPVSPGQPVINISKDYIKAEAGAEGQPGTWAEFDRAAIPLLAVWPYAEILDNSKDKKNTWHLYKYYCEELKIPGAFKIEPYFKDGKTIFKEPVITDLSADEFDTRYGESSSLPSALKLEFSSGTNDKFAGFVFLKKPQQKNQGAKKWDAALDFGTTSTTVFYKEGDDKKAEFLHLLTEYTWNNTGINKPPEPVIEGKEIGQEFKSRKICGSVTSNFEHFFIDKWCFAQSGYITAWEELNPQSGRVFWQNEDTYRIADVTAGARRHNNVKTDLKWDGDTDLPTKYLGHLLTHVTFAAAWQGVGTINWFCSYPTALSPNNEGRFRELILKELLGDTNTEKPKPGVLSKESTGIDVKFEEKAGFVTESEAVARYFMKEREHQPLYLCVDIGGGTSDISVWSQETGKVTYLFQSSVRFASGEMFVNPLKKLLNSSDPAVLDTVLKKEGDPIYRLNYFWGSGQDSGGKHSLHMNDAQLSAVLSEYADEVKKRLWEKNLISRDFTTYVTIAYSGLCFYLAHIIAALFKKNETPMPKEMVFGLSGRGAKLTEWIDADAVHKETEKLIPELFYRGKSGAPFTIMPKFSKEFAKMETAKGLLYGSNAPAEELPAEIYMGADVSFKKDGDEPKPREADDFISRGEDFVISPANWTASFDSGLNSLKEFVKFFDKVVHTSNVKGYKNVKVIGLGWLEENKAHLKTVIDNKFGETMHPQRISDARFESPFIVALKVLLSEYSEKELHFKENQNV
ncbi:MAG: hypothetical protein LBR93_05835, partial [Treponema sp.]|nr:hypothetical protein [Treponema sp.]